MMGPDEVQRLTRPVRRVAGRHAAGPAGAAPAPARLGAEDPGRDARLEEIEELYQHTPIGLCVVDRQLRYVRANEEYARTVGRTVDDLIGRTMAEVVPESARAGAVSAAASVIETGEPASDLELRRVVPGDPEGQRIWLVNIHPVRRDGEVVGAMAVLQNITSIRSAEETARARLEELESIYRNAPVGLAFVDRDLRYLRVNQMIADMNGLGIEEVEGKTYRELSPESADVAEPFLRGVMESGQSVRNLETRVRPPSDPGVEHVYLACVDPVRNAEGEVVGHTSSVQDVTEMRRAEEVAARRLAELETLYAHTPLGLCHMDADLRIVHLNPRFARLAELPMDQQVGASARDVLPGDIARQIVPQLEYVARTGTASSELEIRGCLPGWVSRDYTWVANTYPTTSDAGEVTGIVTVLQDVTRQATRRRESEALRDRLVEAQRVAQLGSWEWNLIEDEVWYSRELYAILGQPAAYEPSYASFIEQVHVDDRERVRAQVEHTLADGNPYRETFSIIRPDGTERVLFTAARLDRTEEGIPARLVGTCLDVTEFGPAPPRRRESGS